jgi:polysaccharide export outer membrane protein
MTFMSIRRTVLLAFAALTLAGIALAQTPANSVVLPPVAGAPQPDPAYQIRKGDKLGIKFIYHPELSDVAVLVRPDGLISLPMIEDIRAAGMTTAELKTKIERAYAESLVNPVIVVSLVEYVAPRVFVGGQVSKPGSYELRHGQTVLQAVTVAGGFTRDAHRKMVLHARPTADGELKITVVDITKLLKPGSGDQELRLQDGDYVFVPDSKISQVTRMVESFRFALPGFGIGIR